jgi:hypothetical protein
MATNDELARLDREIKDAEHAALSNLASHLREAVLNIPSESRLARVFVRQAKEFDNLARARHLAPGTSPSAELHRITEELRVGTRHNVLLAIAKAMRAGADQLDAADRVKRALEHEADRLEAVM